MCEKKRIIVRKERLFFQHYVEVRKENAAYLHRLAAPY